MIDDGRRLTCSYVEVTKPTDEYRSINDAGGRPVGRSSGCWWFSGGSIPAYCCMRWRLAPPASGALQLRALHVHHGLSALPTAGLSIAAAAVPTGRSADAVTHVWTPAVAVDRKRRRVRRAMPPSAPALTEGEALLTAQHLDDQSETFLLALKRGSGAPAGLSAMAARAALGGTCCCGRCWAVRVRR